ncbi:MAG: hypothetical protein N2Z58_09420, partial [Fervidobacterium sp.]|nr:hypothetical protein [Fervidobacterium sp.]
MKLKENELVSFTNIIELPTYSNALYELEYYAENKYGKTDTYKWSFTNTQNQLPPKVINAQRQAGGTSAFVSWSSTNAEFYTLRIFKNNTQTDIIVADNSYLYKATEDNEQVAFAVASGNSLLFSTATPVLNLSKTPDFTSDTTPPNPPVISAQYSYTHNPKGVTITVLITHATRQDVVGTIVYATDNVASGVWQSQMIYKGTDRAIFQFGWGSESSKNFQIRAFSITSTNVLSTAQTVNLTVPKFTQTISAPTLNVLAAGYDTAYCSWSQPTAVGQLKYDLQVSTTSNFASATTITTTDNNHTMQFNYSTDQTLYFRVKTYDLWGNESNWSNIVNVTIKSKASFESYLNGRIANTETQLKQLEGNVKTNLINWSLSDGDGNASLHGWITYTGSGQVVSLTDGKIGNYAFQSNPNIFWSVYSSSRIPINHDATYAV